MLGRTFRTAAIAGLATLFIGVASARPAAAQRCDDGNGRYTDWRGDGGYGYDRYSGWNYSDNWDRQHSDLHRRLGQEHHDLHYDLNRVHDDEHADLEDQHARWHARHDGDWNDARWERQHERMHRYLDRKHQREHDELDREHANAHRYLEHDHDRWHDGSDDYRW